MLDVVELPELWSAAGTAIDLPGFPFKIPPFSPQPFSIVLSWGLVHQSVEELVDLFNRHRQDPRSPRPLPRLDQLADQANRLFPATTAFLSCSSVALLRNSRNFERISTVIPMNPVS